MHSCSLKLPVSVKRTREPGGTKLGEKLRELLLYDDMDPETETLLMFAARRQHIAEIIKPALDAGIFVLSDRFTDATYAYQYGGKQVAYSKIQILEAFTTNTKHDEVFNQLNRKLSYVSKRIGFILVGRKSKSEKVKLIITAHGYKKLFPKVNGLINNAPKSIHWDFQAFIKPKEDIEMFKQGIDNPYIFQDFELKTSELYFKPLEFNTFQKKMKIVVTGGLGFIGSHTVVELQNEGFEVIAIDNLSNSSIDVLDGIERITGKKPLFENIDLRDKSAVQNFFSKHQDISGVIHFAASKAVGESVENPLLYYENNINSLVYLLQELQKKSEAHFIFSSSCTVYGQAEKMPITENAPIQVAMSPYGNTKQIGEEIITDVAKVTNINSILLRYFNPIGAHPSAEIGELPLGVPQNLVPFITQTAFGLREKLSVFGNDYPTTDGTAIRDYIHVVDLAKAHVIALQRLLKKQNSEKVETFNLGTGTGSSVLEVITAFEKVSNQKLNYQIVGRREGDVIEAYANTDKANTVLGWKAKSTLEEALASAWKWEQKIRNK